MYALFGSVHDMMTLRNIFPPHLYKAVLCVGLFRASSVLQLQGWLWRALRVAQGATCPALVAMSSPVESPTTVAILPTFTEEVAVA
jgi:hypothetical protein